MSKKLLLQTRMEKIRQILHKSSKNRQKQKNMLSVLA